MNNKLPLEFYRRDTLTVAKELLGKVLVTSTSEGVSKCRIVETEAYLGHSDKACHSYHKKPFGRVNVMFREGGLSYVYLIYGMYYCFNVVTEQEGVPEAVLIRAGEPLGDTSLTQQRRVKAKRFTQLLNGPGKLCSGMGITKEHYGVPLNSDIIYIEDMPLNLGEQIIATPRINIDYAEEARDFLYRFVIKDNPHISVKVK